MRPLKETYFRLYHMPSGDPIAKSRPRLIYCLFSYSWINHHHLPESWVMESWHQHKRIVAAQMSLIIASITWGAAFSLPSSFINSSNYENLIKPLCFNGRTSAPGLALPNPPSPAPVPGADRWVPFGVEIIVWESQLGKEIFSFASMGQEALKSKKDSYTQTRGLQLCLCLLLKAFKIPPGKLISIAAQKYILGNDFNRGSFWPVPSHST